MLLNLLSLLVGWAGTLYGIWSRPDRNIRIAATASAIATTGILVGVAIVLNNAASGKRRAAEESALNQTQLRGTLASSDLVNLTVAWTFDDVPDDVASVPDLWEMYIHSENINKDDFAAMPMQRQDLVLAPASLEQFIAPVVVAATTPETDLFVHYPDGTVEELAQWQGRGEDFNYFDFSPAAAYEGPVYEILFPLNPDLSAVLSLGDPGDDEVVPQADLPAFDLYETNPYVFRNFEFEAGLESQDDRLTVIWRYDRASLNRATEQREQNGLRGGLPDTFAFIVVHGALDRSAYLSEGSRYFDAPPADGPEGNDWAAESTLTVTVNGLTDAKFQYHVRRGTSGEHLVDMGDYDEPEAAFAYTIFYCSAINPGRVN